MRLSASRTATSTLPKREPTMAPEITRKIASASAEAKHSAARVVVGLHGEAQDVLEVGQAVVAAEAHVVAEEGEQQSEGHRLGDDREIDAGDAAAEGEPAERQRQHARHQHDHGAANQNMSKPCQNQGSSW